MQSKFIRSLVVVLASLLLAGCSVKQQTVLDQSKEIEHERFSKSDFNDVGKLKSPWYKYYNVVAHALGGIDGYDYTNSYEALVYNYNQGTRVFETDIATTGDGELVLLHEWAQYHDIFGLGELDGWSEESYEVFDNSLIYDNYKTLSFKDLLTIMTFIPDFYVILDTKTFEVDSTKEIYKRLIEEINSVDPALIHRFIPQAYSAEIWDAINELADWNDIIFTLYSIYYATDGYQIYQDIKERKIESVVMHMDNDWACKVIRDIRDYAGYDKTWPYKKFNIYIHTINDFEQTKSIVNDEHFKGIYTDFITEKSFNDLFAK